MAGVTGGCAIAAASERYSSLAVPASTAIFVQVILRLFVVPCPARLLPQAIILPRLDVVWVRLSKARSYQICAACSRQACDRNMPTNSVTEDCRSTAIAFFEFIDRTRIIVAVIDRLVRGAIGCCLEVVSSRLECLAFLDLEKLLGGGEDGPGYHRWLAQGRAISDAKTASASKIVKDRVMFCASLARRRLISYPHV